MQAHNKRLTIACAFVMIRKLCALYSHNELTIIALVILVFYYMTRMVCVQTLTRIILVENTEL